MRPREPATTSDRPHIAIIGCGFSGAALAIQLLKDVNAPRLTMIDKSGRFGPGLAYSTTNCAHLLNVRAGRMSLDPAEPQDFAAARGLDPDAFATRESYGAYIEARLRRAMRNAPHGVELVRNSAVRVDLTHRGATIQLASGRSISADGVVLALGNQAAAQPPQISDAAAADPRYIADPWDACAIGRIGADEDVLLLGTGLTMADAALTLLSRPRVGVVHAVSRRGLAPKAHAPTSAQSSPLDFGISGTLSETMSELRRRIAHARGGGASWQHVLDRIRPLLPALWGAMTPDQQARFLRHARPWWDAHRHRIASQAAAWLDGMRAAGRLRLAAAKVVRIESERAGFLATLRHRGARATHDLRVAHIVNCTGPSGDIAHSSDPLIAQLRDDGLIRAPRNGLGLDVTPNGGVVAVNGAAHNMLFAIGPLTQGVFWESTAVPELRMRAAQLAGHLSSMFARVTAHARELRTNAKAGRRFSSYSTSTH